MRIDAMNWMQVEARAAVDDRCVIPLGSTEQHAYLSLATDTILASRVAEEAAAPLGVPVFPALPYGMVSTFLAYPGTVSLKLSTYLALVGDLLDSVYRSGFRRIVLVNGHGGNSPVTPLIGEWLADHTDAQVKLHDWWRAPQVWAKVMATDREASHASWMENFPWTRLADVAMPSDKKPEIDRAAGVSLQSGRKNVAFSATAISTASISGRMRICWRSGRSRSPRPAISWIAIGAKRPVRVARNPRKGDTVAGFLINRLAQDADRDAGDVGARLRRRLRHRQSDRRPDLARRDAGHPRPRHRAIRPLDQPLIVQYGSFLGRVLTGDLGKSLVYNIPVGNLILTRLPATLELTLLAVLFALFVGVPLGMFAGYKPDNPIAKAIMALSILGFSVRPSGSA